MIPSKRMLPYTDRPLPMHSSQYRRTRWLAAAGAAVLLGALLLPAGTGASGDRIAVVVSSGDEPFRQAVAGFQDHLARQGVKQQLDVVTLGEAGETDGAQLQRISSEGPKIVLAVGTAATDLTLRKITGAPVVACLVLRTERIEHAGNAAGVSLEFPLETQFAWLQRILPQARTVGVLYNPAENQRRIDAAVQTAKRFGLRIDAEPVSSPKDVPAALNSLAKRADVLWCIPDAVTLSAVISKNILLFSFRNSIPVIGPSPAWVKAGALYSLDWDYADLGVQCGEMAVKILAGASPASVGVASPRRVQYTLNLATARQMKLDLPDALVKGARQTF